MGPHCCLDHEETIPRYVHGVLQVCLLPPQQGQLARLIPVVVFEQIPLSEERAWWYTFLPSPGSRCYKCLHFAMSSELSSKIIHGISHLALMSAWHMFTIGTWRTLWTSTRGKSAYFTFNVKTAAVRVLQVAARRNSCQSISCRLGCSSPSFTGTWSPGAVQEGSKSPKAFFAVRHSAHLQSETPWGVRRQAQTFPCCFLLSCFLNQQENIAKNLKYISMLSYNIFTPVVTSLKQATKRTSVVST